ncbi:MAG: transketolase C-terminal domain-containing protein, partial [Dehalococcoidia bacterium]|nr:transketolase C-terminal domain-containing protein [Dehalococcoidia bacterium]
SLASEATVAADDLRGQGYKAGVLGLRAYRPFPKEELRGALKKAKLVVVFDKNISYGYEGATCSDLKAALYSSEVRPAVHNYIVGIGGRDVKARELAEAAKRSLLCIADGQVAKATEWLNCQI